MLAAAVDAHEETAIGRCAEEEVLGWLWNGGMIGEGIKALLTHFCLVVVVRHFVTGWYWSPVLAR